MKNIVTIDKCKNCEHCFYLDKTLNTVYCNKAKDFISQSCNTKIDTKK